MGNNSQLTPLQLEYLALLAVMLLLSARPSCQQSLTNNGMLIVFQDRHRTTQAFVGPSHFWSHTSLAKQVVYSSVSARRTAARFNELLRSSRWAYLINDDGTTVMT